MTQDAEHRDGYLTGWAGLDLYTVHDRPVGGACAELVIVHGYAEHSGWYDEVTRRFLGERMAVHRYDMRGHGRSEGLRGDVVRFVDYVRDLETFMEQVKSGAADRPVFLVAHSAGACVAAQYAARNPTGAAGLVALSVYLRDAATYGSLMLAAGRLLRFFAPLAPIQELDPGRISKDPEVVQAYRTDPLVYHGKVRVRMGTHFMEMEKRLLPELASISMPLLVLNGSADRLAAPESSRLLYEAASSTDKLMRTYEGVEHDMLHEPERDRILSGIVDWMCKRTEAVE